MNPSTESPGSDGPRLGRPRDGALTDRVLSGAQDVVIEQGPDRLSADALAAVTGVSRAAIYRRWPDTAALLAEIVTRCRPVPAIPDTGSLRGDLVGLLEPWTRALDRDERLVATVLGRARHSPALRAGLEAAVVHPLDAAVATAVDRHVARGHEVPAGRGACCSAGSCSPCGGSATCPNPRPPPTPWSRRWSTGRCSRSCAAPDRRTADGPPC